MAKISTRPADPQEKTAIEELQEILEIATNGIISTKSTAKVQAGNDLPTVIGNIRMIVNVLVRASSELFRDLGATTHDNMILTVKLAEAMDILEALTDVTYDGALDHATADLMDAFAASGSADVTANGELGFNESILFSKTDLKPILREAILRYIEQKLR